MNYPLLISIVCVSLLSTKNCDDTNLRLLLLEPSMWAWFQWRKNFIARFIDMWQIRCSIVKVLSVSFYDCQTYKIIALMAIRVDRRKSIQSFFEKNLLNCPLKWERQFDVWLLCYTMSCSITNQRTDIILYKNFLRTFFQLLMISASGKLCNTYTMLHFVIVRQNCIFSGCKKISSRCINYIKKKKTNKWKLLMIGYFSIP